MKHCSLSYVSANKQHKDGAGCVNEELSSMPWHMWGGGRGGAPGMVACARISSICGDAPSFTICMFWLVPIPFRLSFKSPLDFSTDALACGKKSKRRENRRRGKERKKT